MGKQYFNQSKLPRIDSEVGHSMNFQMLKYKFPEGIFGFFFRKPVSGHLTRDNCFIFFIGEFSLLIN